MNRTFLMRLFLFLVLLACALFVYRFFGGKKTEEINTSVFTTQVPLQTPTGEAAQNGKEDIPKVSTVASGLDTPWALAFLPVSPSQGGPSGGMLITERKGTVRFVDANGKLSPNVVLELESVKEIGEGGLLGIAIHPDFSSNGKVYLYYTYGERSSQTLNRVSVFKYESEKLSGEKVIVDEIPGAANHDGGRIKFGPDKYLYITTGDAQEPSLAQDKNSLAGKILRVKDDGTPAFGNPFNNRIFSYGHRNPQGITWDKDGSVWETEHGPSGSESGNDEFNKIENGKNYGWPEIRGTQKKPGMVTPVVESGDGTAWAPSGLAYLNNKFYFSGLRGSALYEVSFNGNTPTLKTYFKGDFGRIREVVAGPDGMLYISTSNYDGRGAPKAGDDKILRVNPAKL